MAAELGLLFLTQLQKLAQYHPQQQPEPHPTTTSATNSSATSWMWNPKQLAACYQNDVVVDDDDDSWEIRAFELDAGNINGTTWPPRSYTCTFCRREFRSAQALGGHMNVHRRDRARLHQALPGGANTPAAASSSNFASSATLLIPAQEFVANNNNGGLCLFYSLANPNCLLTPTTLNSCLDSPSEFLPVSATRPATPPTYSNHPATLHSLNSSVCQYLSNNQPSASNNYSDNNPNESKKDSATEELDLELRLGRR